MSAIELISLRARLGGAEVLAGVDLRVAEGETVVLLGPSGAGKSTLVRVILGLLVPSDGEVHLAGRLASAAERVIVPPEARGLGVVFQDLALWPHLTVRKHLAFALGRAGGTAAATIGPLLERLGLTALAERHPGELSGGERQRVAIARALVGEPRAVLLDEPLAHVDVLLKGELLALFRAVLRDRRVATLHVSHDPREAALLADRVALLEAGRITQVGSPAELRAAPATAFGRAVAAQLA